MARLLYKQDSVVLHKRLTRRHIRLCGQIKGGATCASAIQPKLDNLLITEQALSVANETYENTSDDLILKDADLDNAVRTLFERSRQYDRENGGNVAVLLFPDLTYSDIINMPYAEEPKKVSTLIQKLETLEQGHELRSLIDVLQQKVNAVNAALDAKQQAADNVRRCQVQEELTKNEVRAQYETNYLDARKTLGRQVAESLFPKIANQKSRGQENELNPEQGE
ncbi:MAG: hypothetical protein LBE04_01395 [Prevotellaceae bacterium]|jgi:hypothetical protein|nr:hypothetical protein [Prevotellaceae bacterium]